jgi:hypothetical protein
LILGGCMQRPCIVLSRPFGSFDRTFAFINGF